MEVAAHKELVAALEGMVAAGRVPHALLFHEDDGGGALPLVLHFLDILYGHNPRVRKLIHPDVHFIFPVAGSDKPVSEQFLSAWRTLVLERPFFFERELYAAIGIEGKQSNISVNEARLLLDKLSLSAVEGGYRSVVLYLPEKLNAAAANALLKMVEEPPQQTLFCLITHAPEKVLPTIFSRCLFLRVPPLSRADRQQAHAAENQEETQLRDLFHDLMEALVQKDLLSALETGEALAALESREKQKAFCAFAAGDIRDIFLLQQGLSSLTDLPEGERESFDRWASALKKTFPRQAASQLDRSNQLIERNVSQKILFADLVNRLYMNASV